MKRLILSALIAATFVFAAPFATASPECFGCATIQSGTILDSSSNVVTVGYDDWGYNYQGHKYDGYYDNYDRTGILWTDDNCDSAPYGCVTLQMKWSDSWLANVDCDGDNKLDRPSDAGGTYLGSDAWITNHMSGSYPYTDSNGKLKEAHWTYFVKIVAVPVDATLTGGVYFNAEGEEIGPMIWSQFAIIQSVYNDPVGGFHGIEYLSPVNPGLASSK